MQLDEQVKQAAADTIPNVGPTLVIPYNDAAGGLILVLMIAAFVQNMRKTVGRSPLLLKALLWGLPLPWIAMESGWFN